MVNRPITITLGTADPGEARRLASRLAVIWDETEMDMQSNFQRGILTIEEREAKFKNALKRELAHATAHKSAPIGDRLPQAQITAARDAASSGTSKVRIEGLCRSYFSGA